MNTGYDMEHNAVLLKRCHKIYNTITIIYASICIPYALSQIFAGILFYDMFNPISVIFDSLLCKSALLVCGFLACYKHNNKFILFALLIQTINILITNGSLNICLFYIVIILSGFTVYANKKYQYLTEQFGFPYFNERIEEKNFEYRKSKLKTEFQQNYERYKMQSSDSMINIDTNNYSGDAGNNDSGQSGTMTDIDLNYQSNDLGQIITTDKA